MQGPELFIGALTAMIHKLVFVDIHITCLLSDILVLSSSLSCLDQVLHIQLVLSIQHWFENIEGGQHMEENPSTLFLLL